MPDSQQLTLDDVSQLTNQCRAIADDTGEQCQHTPIASTPYCHDHIHLLEGGLASRLGYDEEQPQTRSPASIPAQGGDERG